MRTPCEKKFESVAPVQAHRGRQIPVACWPTSLCEQWVLSSVRDLLNKIRWMAREIAQQLRIWTVLFRNKVRQLKLPVCNSSSTGCGILFCSPWVHDHVHRQIDRRSRSNKINLKKKTRWRSNAELSQHWPWASAGLCTGEHVLCAKFLHCRPVPWAIATGEVGAALSQKQHLPEQKTLS